MEPIDKLHQLQLVLLGPPWVEILRGQELLFGRIIYMIGRPRQGKLSLPLRHLLHRPPKDLIISTFVGPNRRKKFVIASLSLLTQKVGQLRHLRPSLEP